MKIAVLGGGITGCVFAGKMAGDPRFQIDLFEKADRLGGLHHSPFVNGLAYDVGAFFFEVHHIVFETFPGLVELYVEFPVKVTSVSDGGKLDRYPLTLKGYIRNHGIAHFTRALGALLAGKARHRRRDSLPAFIKYYVGGAVYERSGLRSYIERLYSLPADEIDLVFAEQRMGDLARWASFRNIARRFLERPSKLWTESYYHPTALARPEAGFSAAYGHIEADLRARGIGIHKGANVTRIAREEDGFRLHFPDGSRDYDLVVSTVPLPVTARLLGIPLEHRFDTVSLLTLFYRFRGDPGYDAAVLSNFTHSGAWKRIIDFSRYYGDRNGHWLSAEIPLSGPADVESACRAFEEHVRGLALFDGNLSFEGHALTPNAYPIYRVEGIEKLGSDKERVLASGVILAGRQGQFEYVTSDQAARSAAELAERIKAERPPWSELRAA